MGLLQDLTKLIGAIGQHNQSQPAKPAAKPAAPTPQAAPQAPAPVTPTAPPPPSGMRNPVALLTALSHFSQFHDPSAPPVGGMPKAAQAQSFGQTKLSADGVMPQPAGSLGYAPGTLQTPKEVQAGLIQKLGSIHGAMPPAMVTGADGKQKPYNPNGSYSYGK